MKRVSFLLLTILVLAACSDQPPLPLPIQVGEEQARKKAIIEDLVLRIKKTDTIPFVPDSEIESASCDLINDPAPQVLGYPRDICGRWQPYRWRDGQRPWHNPYGGPLPMDSSQIAWWLPHYGPGDLVLMNRAWVDCDSCFVSPYKIVCRRWGINLDFNVQHPRMDIRWSYDRLADAWYFWTRGDGYLGYDGVPGAWMLAGVMWPMKPGIGSEPDTLALTLQGCWGCIPIDCEWLRAK